jgi:ATP-dependent DNA helicase 2 subunit 2
MLAFSALLWAMRAKDRYAVIRLVPPSNVQLGQKQPRIGILIPCVGEDAIEGLEMGLLLPMPFKEELANWSFPSLDRILTVTGVPVTEHRLLPKPDLLDAMDKFADSMMLPSTSEEGQASGSRAAG